MLIYQHLSESGESCVSDLVKVVKLTQPTVSYHLKEMKENGLLFSKKLGKETYYGVLEHCPNYSSPCILKNANVNSN